MNIAEELHAMQACRHQRRRKNVEYVQANHPEMAAWLSEMTAEFGRCEYLVTMREVESC